MMVRCLSVIGYSFTRVVADDFLTILSQKAMESVADAASDDNNFYVR